MSLDEIRQLDARAAKLGVKALWAGGISLPQTFEFGKLGVFGIYVTSAAAALVPLDRHYAAPIRRSGAAVREPTPNPWAASSCYWRRIPGQLGSKLSA